MEHEDPVELVAKLSAVGVAEGTAVRWVDDNGTDVVRPR